MSFLQEKWNALTKEYDVAIAAAAWNEIQRQYSSPERAYHNLAHLEYIFRQLDDVSVEITDPQLVGFCIFYHDLICIPGRGDNESRSASEGKIRLERMGMEENRIKTFVLYIQATQNHSQLTLDHKDLRYFLDADLAILAAARTEYRKYAEGIQKEYGRIPAYMYRNGRIAFLRHLMTKPHLFHTKEFRRKEAVAFANIQWEIDWLERVV